MLDPFPTEDPTPEPFSAEDPVPVEEVPLPVEPVLEAPTCAKQMVTVLIPKIKNIIILLLINPPMMKYLFY
jgi:hypothetical protein